MGIMVSSAKVRWRVTSSSWIPAAVFTRTLWFTESDGGTMERFGDATFYGRENHGGPFMHARRGARPGQAPPLQPGRDGGGDAPGVDGAHGAGPDRAHGSPKR